MAEAHSLDEETGTHECNVAVGTNGEKKADGCSSELFIDNEAGICSVRMDDSKESASSDAVWHNSPAFKFISRPDLYQFAKAIGNQRLFPVFDLIEAIRSDPSLLQVHQDDPELVRALNSYARTNCDLPKGWERLVHLGPEEWLWKFRDYRLNQMTFIDPRLPFPGNELKTSKLCSKVGFPMDHEDYEEDYGQRVRNAFWDNDIKTATSLLPRTRHIGQNWLQSGSGATLLHYSCRHGWQDVTENLVRKYGYRSNQGDVNRWTPIHEACKCGNLQILAFLVGVANSNTACVTRTGDTLLHAASYGGHVEVVKFLHNQQLCDLSKCNKRGETILHVACSWGHLDLAKFLVNELGCDSQPLDNSGNTPLHLACLRGNVEIARFLVWKGTCKPQHRNKDGNTPLHLASSNGHSHIVNLLRYDGCCDVLAPNHDGDTPLHLACRNKHVDTVSLLLSVRDCNPMQQNNNGDTPLHDVCRYFHHRTVLYLLSSGKVHPFCRNRAGKTPGDLTRNPKILQAFQDFSDYTRLFSESIEPAMKIFFLGNTGAGKTTLAKAIERKVTSRLGSVLAGNLRHVSSVESPTTGIDTTSLRCKHFGKVIFYDLSGLVEYHSSHDAFLEKLVASSVAVFALTVEMCKPEVEIINTLRYWVHLVENVCARVDCQAHLIVVGSWKDRATILGEDIQQKWSQIQKATLSYSAHLHFTGFVSLDCRQLASSGLDTLCRLIQRSCSILREIPTTRLLYPHAFQAFNSKKLTPIACTVGELMAHLAKAKLPLLPTTPELLSPILSTLSDSGNLLYLPHKDTLEAGWIIRDTQALSMITGTILAPKNSKHYHEIASSSGVVPASKIATLFPQYSIEMVTGVLTHLEVCHDITDPTTLSMIATSDPFRQNNAASSNESYYFFPALVHANRPETILDNTHSSQYQCGWSMQCVLEGHYFTPRFLHVLLLRLASSFALTSEQPSVAGQRCSIWRNGIHWTNPNGIQTVVEAREQSRRVVVLLSCPEGQEMACVHHRSALIQKVLEIKEEFCPSCSIAELLIDPATLYYYPTDVKSLKMCTVPEIAKAIQEGKDCVIDQTGTNHLALSEILYFEPYLHLNVTTLTRIFSDEYSNQKIEDRFLHDLSEDLVNAQAEQSERTQTQEGPLHPDIQRFQAVLGSELTTCNHPMPTEPISPYFNLLAAWRESDPNGGTYGSLCSALNKYSIFCGRNLLDPIAG